MIEATLDRFAGHRSRKDGLMLLGIGLRTLSGKLKAYGYAPAGPLAGQGADEPRQYGDMEAHQTICQTYELPCPDRQKLPLQRRQARRCAHGEITRGFGEGKTSKDGRRVKLVK